MIIPHGSTFIVLIQTAAMSSYIPNKPCNSHSTVGNVLNRSMCWYEKCETENKRVNINYLKWSHKLCEWSHKYTGKKLWVTQKLNAHRCDSNPKRLISYPMHFDTCSICCPTYIKATLDIVPNIFTTYFQHTPPRLRNTSNSVKEIIADCSEKNIKYILHSVDSGTQNCLIVSLAIHTATTRPSRVLYFTPLYQTCTWQTVIEKINIILYLKLREMNRVPRDHIVSSHNNLPNYI